MDSRAIPWPDNALYAMSLSFDVDAEAGFLGEGDSYRSRLSSLTSGSFSVRRGVPRILDILDEYDLKATFFVPGYTAELHRGIVQDMLERGHEIGYHGYMHLRNDLISGDEQREEMERGIQALEEAGAPRPVGHRAASWELTPETFSLVVEYGFEYDSSCMGDDRPYVESFEGMSILELPVHWTLDDWPYFGWSLDRGGNMCDPMAVAGIWEAEIDHARKHGHSVILTNHPEVIGRGCRMPALERIVEKIASDSGSWVVPLRTLAEYSRDHLTTTPA